MILSISAIWQNRWIGIIPAVLSVIFSSIFAASISKVSSLMSTKTGLPPCFAIQDVDARNVNGEVIKLYMLIVLSFLIELALLVTSWDIWIDKPGVVQPESMEAGNSTVLQKTAKRKNNLSLLRKTCPVCGIEFPAKRNSKIYCSDKCKQSKHRNGNVA
jgi:hypothetical protein